MSKHLLLTLITATCTGLAAPAGAHVGDRIYQICELTDADLAAIDLKDGTVGDWEEVLGEPTLTAVDFVMYGQLDLFNTADGFADFVLVGADGKLPEGSTVESDSWARIKASFGR